MKPENVTVTYEGHSGFSVRTPRHLLAFDVIRPMELRKEDHALVFVSHGHSDHCFPEVQRWADDGLCRLVIGSGTRLSGCLMNRGDALEMDGVSVRAFGSTDEGVSFLVRADGFSLFHAGDLNFWHWKDESTSEEVEEARALFEDALSEIGCLRPDIAFFPIDPRMGPDCDEGAVMFVEKVRPKLLIPMHFWDDSRAALAFAQKPQPEGVRVRVLTTPGEQLTEGR